MAASTLSWLDYTDEDQRRARELIALFSETESRDELGVGSVRDALSELMFPGTSVIQTRARYFLFVPWLYIDGARRGYASEALHDWVQQRERDLIGALKAGGDEEGLIGRVAGRRVKNLPSTLYWSGLQRFGIMLTDGSLLDAAAATQGRSRASEEALTELVDRSPSPWRIPPPPPEGWPHVEACDFRMTRDEAEWLCELIESKQGTLLAHLAQARARLSGSFPWDDLTVRSAPASIAHVVEQAERFSLLMNGAALLYNLLLAERCVQLQLTEDNGLATRYREALDRWSEEVHGHELAQTHWDLNELWAVTSSEGGDVPHLTRVFVSDWLVAAEAAGWDIAGSATARALVSQREQRRKGPQSRFTNEKLLRQWGGGSGTGRLSYRWPQVRRILGDIVDGLERTDA